MKRFPILHWLSAVCFVLWVPFLVMAESDSIGVVTFVKGDMFLTREEKQVPLKVDEKVQKTDVIEAGGNGKARIVFCGEVLNGMKVVVAGEKLDVAQLLARKPEDRSLSSLAADVLQSFSRQETTRETVATTRNALRKKRRMVIFPTARSMGPISEIIWRPLPGATKYLVNLEFSGDGAPVTQTYELAGTRLRYKLPDFQPGVKYTLTLIASSEKAEMEKEEISFALSAPGEIDGLLAVPLAEIDKNVGDPEDPTGFLLRGNLLLNTGFAGEAVLQYLKYSVAVGKTAMARSGIRKALLRLQFEPSDIDGSIDALIDGYMKQD